MKELTPRRAFSTRIRVKRFPECRGSPKIAQENSCAWLRAGRILSRNRNSAFRVGMVPSCTDEITVSFSASQQDKRIFPKRDRFRGEGREPWVTGRSLAGIVATMTLGRESSHSRAIQAKTRPKLRSRTRGSDNAIAPGFLRRGVAGMPRQGSCCVPVDGEGACAAPAIGDAWKGGIVTWTGRQAMTR